MFSPGSSVHELTTQDEVEALMSAQGGVAVLDFWSPTSDFCEVMEPLLEEMARRFEGQPIRFCHVNTLKCPEIAEAFQIQAVPPLRAVLDGEITDVITDVRVKTVHTVIFVLNGQVMDVFMGEIHEEDLVSKIARLLSMQRGEGFWHRLVGLKKSG
jgi:thioredoxin-like negative regulator of GroEL